MHWFLWIIIVTSHAAAQEVTKEMDWKKDTTTMTTGNEDYAWIRSTSTYLHEATAADIA